MRELIARAIAANKMGLSNNGERLPDDLWRQALPAADHVLASLDASGFQIVPKEATPAISEDIRGLLEKSHRALSPFVFEAKAYDPPEDDDNHLLYGEHHLTIGHLRNARDAYDAILAALGSRAMLAAAKETDNA